MSLIAGTNSRLLSSATNSYIVGNNIVAGIPNTTYTGQLSVIGDCYISGNLSAAQIGGSQDLSETINFVKANSGTFVQVTSLVASQSAYWMEPVRRFEYVYGTGNNTDISYSGMAPASANADSFVFNPVWTITRLTYTFVGSISAVDKAFRVSWSSRASTPYTRIWTA